MRILSALVFLGACGGGGDGGGGDDQPGPDAPKPAYEGYLSIQSYDAMNVPGTPTRGGTASAAFYTGAGICSVMETIGPCDVSQCTSGPPAGPMSAGAITITGAQQPITLMPMLDKSYAQFTTTAAPLYAGGESITFSAAGADVPAFSQSLTMPSKATITSPTKPATKLTVPRSAEYAVSWSGGGAGVVQVMLFTSSPDLRLFCRFMASSGSGKVPVAALMKLPAGDGGYAIGAVNRTAKVAGDYQVEVSSYFNAVWADNSIVSGAASFQ